MSVFARLNRHAVPALVGFWLGLALLLAAPVSAAGGWASFPAGTPVVLADGSTLPIEQVRGGMLLMTRDQDRPEAGTWAGVVTRTFRREVDHQLRVHFADGGSIDCTDEHPFYAVDRVWTGSGSLRPGDRVLAGLATGSEHDAVGVERVERIAGGVVYNFEVATDHTYFVQGHGGTEVPVWVHNVCKFGTWMSLVTPPVQELSRKLLAGATPPRVSTGRALTEAELRDAMDIFIKHGPGKHGPVYIVRETTYGGAKNAAAQAKQKALESSLRSKLGTPITEAVALRRQIAPGSRQHPLVIFDAQRPGQKELFDAKHEWGPTHMDVIGSNGQPRKLYNTLLRWGDALAQNPGHTLTVVVPDDKVAEMAEKLTRLKEKIRLAKGRIAGFDSSAFDALDQIQVVGIGSVKP